MKLKHITLIFILFAASAVAKSPARRSIASYEIENVNKGISVFSNFLKCAKILEDKSKTKEDYTKCTDKYLSSKLSKSTKNKYSAWALMSLEPKNFKACKDDYIDYDNNYDLAICFDITVDILEKEGKVIFNKENGAFKIYRIKY